MAAGSYTREDVSMLKTILTWGLVAGLVVGIPMFAITLTLQGHIGGSYGMLVGYLTMLVALSAVFVGVKRYRDIELGGVIGFWPAFGVGLGISIVAGILYVLAWEVTQSFLPMDFGAAYAKEYIEQQQAAGVSGEALAKITAEMDAFTRNYHNPAFRLPMTFIEIFPVGVLVSLVTAALLRNSRFLALRRA
jgi:uncharacterized protein DUF4199